MADGETWVAVVHYRSDDPRGGSWMSGAGPTRQAALVNAVRRHQRILGAPPPRGSGVEYWRADKWVASGRVK